MDSFSGFANKSFQEHRNLTCSLCTRYYNDPRFLPCHHTFCLSCIRTLCDKLAVASPISSKKQKISCPKCKAHINIPAEGVESFPVDYKTQTLKEKVIQDLAQNISRSINNPREDISSRFANTSPIGNAKFQHSDSKNTQEKDDDNTNFTNQGFENSSSIGHSSYGDFSKYAKYFNQEGSVDSDYKPTIRADHTRVGYESSTRFRNRRLNSKERQGSEEKELRRRTWYGSTLQSRRAQSLNRASMFIGGDDKEKKPENLSKISEDREQSTPSETFANLPRFDRGTPPNRKSTFENRPSFNPSFRNKEEKTDYFRPKSAHIDASTFEAGGTNDSFFEKPHKRDFKSRAGLGGPTRTSLLTHRENLVTDDFLKQKLNERMKSNEKSAPIGPDTSTNSRKKSPKSTDFKNSKLISPPSSPKRTSANNFKYSGDSLETSERQGPRTFVGSRHQRFQRPKHADNQNWRSDFKVFDIDFTPTPPRDTGRAHSVASREKLHLDIDIEEPNENGPELQSQFGPEDPSPRRSRSRKTRKNRCRSVESRFSLNKNDFNSDTEFREHLLNMTMSKEKYQQMMEDFKKGQLNNMRSDSMSVYECDEIPNLKEDDKENVNVEISHHEENIAEEVKPSKAPREPLIDENLIVSFRAKYSSPLDVKRYPRQETYPEFCDGVSKLWSCQKNEYGIPTSAVFLSEGNLVVAEYGLNSLEFFDTGGHLEHDITGIKPYGLTLSGLNKNIIVGDRKSKCIRIFDEFGADVSQIDNLDNVEWLAGMASKMDGGLVLCDRGRCKILICTCSGEKVSEFGSFGSSSKQLCMADFLAVDSKNRILVADSGNHCIKVFDPNGSYLKTIGSRGNGEGQMEWPKGIAVDDKDNIIVADTSNHRISLYSPDGVFVKHLMTSIPDPYNITWSRGKLGVLHYNLKGMSQYDVYAC